MRRMPWREDRRVRGYPAAWAVLLATGLGVAGPAGAEPGFDVSLGAYLDDASGRSLDLDVGFAPDEYWAFSAGVGRATASDDVNDIDARIVRALAQVQGESVGARVSYSEWDDSGEFKSRTTAGTLFWRSGGWQVGALYEDRRLQFDYVVALPLRSVALSQEIAGDGYGLDVSYYGERWGGYLRAVSYRYDESLDRLIAASQRPDLERFPRIAALVGSLLTRAAGALDRDLQVGVDRSFGRSGMRVDATFYTDAIDRADSRGLSASYRYALSPRTMLEGTLGVTDTEGLGSLGFGGLSILYRH
jgi:hypothetical protein